MVVAGGIFWGLTYEAPDPVNVCMMNYNSALADVVHMKIKIQRLEQQMQQLQQGPGRVRGWVLWSI
jgi:hypothetical protein